MFCKIRKCHCDFRHASLQARKSLEFVYNRHLNHYALETRVLNRVLELIVLECSSPIRNHANHPILACSTRWKVGMEILLTSVMLYSKILFSLFEEVISHGVNI